MFTDEFSSHIFDTFSLKMIKFKPKSYYKAFNVSMLTMWCIQDSFQPGCISSSVPVLSSSLHPWQSVVFMLTLLKGNFLNFLFRLLSANVYRENCVIIRFYQFGQLDSFFNFFPFSYLSSQQGYGCESKLYSLDHGHEKPQDKKKRTSGLATLKKKFIKRRKSNRSADHAKQMRELLSGWDVRDVNALVEEYEGTSALKELSLQASVARPEARTLQKDMADLYEYKYCTDVDLIFQETCFPVHRAILAARCPFFKTLLSSSPEYGAEIIMDINTAGIDMPMFSALLHYLYTGEFGMEDSRFQNVDILVQLRDIGARQTPHHLSCSDLGRAQNPATWKTCCPTQRPAPGQRGQRASLPPQGQPCQSQPCQSQPRPYVSVPLPGGPAITASLSAYRGVSKHLGRRLKSPNRPNQLPTLAALRNPGAGRSLLRGPAPLQGA